MIKKIIITFFLLLPSISLANAGEISVDVNGLVCEFCAVTIEKSFAKRDEVKEVKVDLELKKVFITLKSGMNLGDNDIKEIIINNGYNVVKVSR